MDDDELIVAVAAGEDAALRELFTRHAPWLAARLRGMLVADAVEDVLQETFLAVWRGAGSYRPQGVAGGWLWGIARRQAALSLRRGGHEVVAGPVEVPDPADAALTRMELEAAVAELGSAERQVWRLLYEQDRSVAEVSRAMGIPEGTVKSRAFRARSLLRRALGQEGSR
jgi:RNA polymerase sigma-70 factor (ECF subfamily)